MGEEEPATLDGQFFEFSKLMDNKRPGITITLYRSDYWMRQAKIIDDRKITMTDTGILFNKFRSLSAHITYCKPYNDSYICWGPATPGQTLYSPCPPVRFSNPSHGLANDSGPPDGMAFRTCGVSGFWLDKRENESVFAGWTNYTPCFEQDVNTLFNKVSDEHASIKFDIAQNTRYLEIVGFSISLLALLLSLVIYKRFKVLVNNRTKIHMNLFSAMVVQVLIRMVIYLDHEFVNHHSQKNNASTIGLQNVPYLCEFIYVVLEYSMTAMFLWMFLEGLYLNKLVSGHAMKHNISYAVYIVIGWGHSFLITIVWAIVNGIKYSGNDVNKCWFGYNFRVIYWIVQGPRVGVMVTNFLFLMNILRVVFHKLRRSENSDVAKVKKALRAALVLLPLLGLTNILNMVQGPLEGEPWKFAAWSYSTHFLRSFEGFFIALLYCFLNTEVQNVIRKYIENQKAIRETQRRHGSLPRRERSSSAARSEDRSTVSCQSRTKSEGTQTKAAFRSLYRLPAQYANLPYSKTRVSMPSILLECPHQPDGIPRAVASCALCIAEANLNRYECPHHPEGLKRNEYCEACLAEAAERLKCPHQRYGISRTVEYCEACLTEANLYRCRKCIGTDTASPLPRRSSAGTITGRRRSSCTVENARRGLPIAGTYPLHPIRRYPCSYKSDPEVCYTQRETQL